jgi:hypothetical protein
MLNERQRAGDLGVAARARRRRVLAPDRDRLEDRDDADQADRHADQDLDERQAARERRAMERRGRACRLS